MSGKNYNHQLDARNRMRIPAKYREELGAGYTITLGVGGCLSVYTKEEMDKLRKLLTNLNGFRESQIKAARYLLSNSWEAEEDNQGRILLPENLRNYAKIVKNVVVCKGPTNIEIWSEEVYKEYFKDVSFEDLADAIDLLKNDGRV